MKRGNEVLARILLEGVVVWDPRMVLLTQFVKRSQNALTRKITGLQAAIQENNLQTLAPSEENDPQDAKTKRALDTRDVIHPDFVSSHPELQSQSSRHLHLLLINKITPTDDLTQSKMSLTLSRLGQEGAVVEQHEEVTVVAMGALQPFLVDSITALVAKKSIDHQHQIDPHQLALLRVEDEETSTNRLLPPPHLQDHLATLIQRG